MKWKKLKTSKNWKLKSSKIHTLISFFNSTANMCSETESEMIEERALVIDC